MSIYDALGHFFNYFGYAIGSIGIFAATTRSRGNSDTNTQVETINMIANQVRADLKECRDAKEEQAKKIDWLEETVSKLSSVNDRVNVDRIAAMVTRHDETLSDISAKLEAMANAAKGSVNV